MSRQSFRNYLVIAGAAAAFAFLPVPGGDVVSTKRYVAEKVKHGTTSVTFTVSNGEFVRTLQRPYDIFNPQLRDMKNGDTVVERKVREKLLWEAAAEYLFDKRLPERRYSTDIEIIKRRSRLPESNP